MGALARSHSPSSHGPAGSRGETQCTHKLPCTCHHWLGTCGALAWRSWKSPRSAACLQGVDDDQPPPQPLQAQALPEGQECSQRDAAAPVAAAQRDRGEDSGLAQIKAQSLALAVFRTSPEAAVSGSISSPRRPTLSNRGPVGLLQCGTPRPARPQPEQVGDGAQVLPPRPAQQALQYRVRAVAKQAAGAWREARAGDA